MVGSTCGRMGTGGSGFLDLPEGSCEITATRVDGPFNVSGPPTKVEIVAGEEIYALVEIPSDPWGGVGVTLEMTEDGIRIESLLPNAAAAGAIPEGAVVLGVDGEELGELTARGLGTLLAGPAGSEVEVRYSWEGPDGYEEETVVIERAPIKASEVSITSGPPG
jgi:hypothetical protein